MDIDLQGIMSVESCAKPCHISVSYGLSLCADTVVVRTHLALGEE